MGGVKLTSIFQHFEKLLSNFVFADGLSESESKGERDESRASFGTEELSEWQVQHAKLVLETLPVSELDPT